MSDWPDIEGAMRDYLRADTAVNALIGNRQFFAVPATPTYPLLTVSRVGGGQDADTDAPIDVALVSIDIWGELDANGYGDKAGALAVVNAVRSALEAISGRTTLTNGVTGHGAEVVGVAWAPDPDNGRPHYAVTAEVTATSS
jgi:hypothetical protein